MPDLKRLAHKLRTGFGDFLGGVADFGRMGVDQGSNADIGNSLAAGYVGPGHAQDVVNAAQAAGQGVTDVGLGAFDTIKDLGQWGYDAARQHDPSSIWDDISTAATSPAVQKSASAMRNLSDLLSGRYIGVGADGSLRPAGAALYGQKTATSLKQSRDAADLLGAAFTPITEPLSDLHDTTRVIQEPLTYHMLQRQGYPVDPRGPLGDLNTDIAPAILGRGQDYNVQQALYQAQHPGQLGPPSPIPVETNPEKRLRLGLGTGIEDVLTDPKTYLPASVVAKAATGIEGALGLGPVARTVEQAAGAASPLTVAQKAALEAALVGRGIAQTGVRLPLGMAGMGGETPLQNVARALLFTTGNELSSYAVEKSGAPPILGTVAGIGTAAAALHVLGSDTFNPRYAAFWRDNEQNLARLAKMDDAIARVYAVGPRENASGVLPRGVAAVAPAEAALPASAGLPAELDTLVNRRNALYQRMYHGTNRTFDIPDPGYFDPHGYVGPAYYLTSDPQVAGGRIGEHWRTGEPEVREPGYSGPPSMDPAAYEAEAGRIGAPQVRPVDVPRDLNLFDLDGTAVDPNALYDGLLARHGTPGQNGQRYIVDEYAEAAQALEYMPGFRQRTPSGPGGGEAPHLSAEQFYRRLGDPTTANRILSQLGFDGIRYEGGRIIPMSDASGNPIQHTAVAIFAESLPKVYNALSGRPMGIFSDQDITGARIAASEKARAQATAAGQWQVDYRSPVTQQMEMLGRGYRSADEAGRALEKFRKEGNYQDLSTAPTAEGAPWGATHPDSAWIAVHTAYTDLQKAEERLSSDPATTGAQKDATLAPLIQRLEDARDAYRAERTGGSYPAVTGQAARPVDYDPLTGEPLTKPGQPGAMHNGALSSDAGTPTVTGETPSADTLLAGTPPDLAQTKRAALIAKDRWQVEIYDPALQTYVPHREGLTERGARQAAAKAVGGGQDSARAVPMKDGALPPVRGDAYEELSFTYQQLEKLQKALEAGDDVDEGALLEAERRVADARRWYQAALANPQAGPPPPALPDVGEILASNGLLGRPDPTQPAPAPRLGRAPLPPMRSPESMTPRELEQELMRVHEVGRNDPLSAYGFEDKRTMSAVVADALAGNTEDTGLLRDFVAQQRALPREAPGSVSLPPDLPTASWITTGMDRLKEYAYRGQAMRDWYERSTRILGEARFMHNGEIRPLFHDENEVAAFVSFLAAFSPNNAPETNFYMALKAWGQYKKGLPLSGFMSTHKLLGTLALRGEDYSTPKVWSFSQNLVDLLAPLLESSNREVDPRALKALTVDIWAMRALQQGTAIPVDDPTTPLMYAQARSQYRRLADIMTRETGQEWSPAAAQAAVWVALRDDVEAAKALTDANGKKITFAKPEQFFGRKGVPNARHAAWMELLPSVPMSAHPDTANTLTVEPGGIRSFGFVPFREGVPARGGDSYDQFLQKVPEKFSGQSPLDVIERAGAEPFTRMPTEAIPADRDRALPGIIDAPMDIRRGYTNDRFRAILPAIKAFYDEHGMEPDILTQAKNKWAAAVPIGDKLGTGVYDSRANPMTVLSLPDTMVVDGQRVPVTDAVRDKFAALVAELLGQDQALYFVPRWTPQNQVLPLVQRIGPELDAEARALGVPDTRGGVVIVTRDFIKPGKAEEVARHFDAVATQKGAPGLLDFSRIGDQLVFVNLSRELGHEVSDAQYWKLIKDAFETLPGGTTREPAWRRLFPQENMQFRRFEGRILGTSLAEDRQQWRSLYARADRPREAGSLDQAGRGEVQGRTPAGGGDQGAGGVFGRFVDYAPPPGLDHDSLTKAQLRKAGVDPEVHQVWRALRNADTEAAAAIAAEADARARGETFSYADWKKQREAASAVQPGVTLPEPPPLPAGAARAERSLAHGPPAAPQGDMLGVSFVPWQAFTRLPGYAQAPMAGAIAGGAYGAQQENDQPRWRNILEGAGTGAALGAGAYGAYRGGRAAVANTNEFGKTLNALVMPARNAPAELRKAILVYDRSVNSYGKTLNAADEALNKTAEATKLGDFIRNRTDWTMSDRRAQGLIAAQNAALPAGATPTIAPEGFSRTSLPGQARQAWVRNDVADLVNAYFSEPPTNRGTRLALRLGEESKAARLGADVALLGMRIPAALVQIASVSDPVRGPLRAGWVLAKTMKDAFPGYQGGVDAMRSEPDYAVWSKSVSGLGFNSNAPSVNVGGGQGRSFAGDALVERIPGVKQIYKPTEGWQFDKVMPIFKYRMAQAMYALVHDSRMARGMTDDQIRWDVAQRVNRMFNGMDRAEAGTSRTQEAVSSLVSLSPAWARGTVALATDAAKPGLEGAMARRFWAGMAVYGVTLAVGGSMVAANDYSRAHLDRLLDPRNNDSVLNPDGPNFLKVELPEGEGKVDVWGPVTPMFRAMFKAPVSAAGQVGEQLNKDRSTPLWQAALTALDAYAGAQKEASVNWLEGRRSMPLGFVQDFQRHEDAMGRPLPDDAPHQALWMASQFAPGGMDAALDNDKSAIPEWNVSQRNIGRGIAGVVGVRFSPSPDDPYAVRKPVSDFLTGHGLDPTDDPLGVYRHAGDAHWTPLERQQFEQANPQVPQLVAQRQIERAQTIAQPRDRDALALYTAKVKELDARKDADLAKLNQSFTAGGMSGVDWRRLHQDIMGKYAEEKNGIGFSYLGEADPNKRQAKIDAMMGTDKSGASQDQKALDAYYSFQSANPQNPLASRMADVRRRAFLWSGKVYDADNNVVQEFAPDVMERTRDYLFHKATDPTERRFAMAQNAWAYYQALPRWQGVDTFESWGISDALARAHDLVSYGGAKDVDEALMKMSDIDANIRALARQAAKGRLRQNPDRKYFLQEAGPLMAQFYSDLLNTDLTLLPQASS